MAIATSGACAVLCVEGPPDLFVLASCDWAVE
jgi:hypothetical protein